MFKFNNNHIFTGYLKQLLASFHLPKCRVYTKEQENFVQERGEKLITLQGELNYFETCLADNEKFLTTCQEEFSEIQKDLLTLDQKGLNETQSSKYTELSSSLTELKANIAAAQEEINQLQSISPNTSEELEQAITELESLIQEQSSIQQEITDLLGQGRAQLTPATGKDILETILEINTKLTTLHDEKVKLNEQLQTKIAQIQETIQELPQELNVIPTIYHSTFSVYPGEIPKETPLKYPEKLRYMPYIKNGFLQVYTDNNWHNCHATFANSTEHKAFHESIKAPFATIPYTYGQKILNYTKNLQIQNTVYDSYTHEYLGDYLRFHRDFANINLMPLYNCFSNRACPHLDISFKLVNNYEVKFKTDQSFETSLYKYYMVPVKFFKNYTIAIDSEASVEVCCCIYDEYHNTDDNFTAIPKLTYQCFSDMQFKKPQLYTGIQKLNSLLLTATPDNKNDLCQQEDNLKLILKIPANNKSSIVILEGEYTAYNDVIARFIPNEKSDDPDDKIFVAESNKTVINYENLNACEFLSDKLITPLQLLRTNTGESYPFADRLVEYLVGNAITVNEEIKDNVVRVKTIIKSNCDPDVAVITAEDGIWEPILQCLVYDYINSNSKTNNHDINHDILGFIDKDVEKWYAIQTKSGPATTIANVDIYE